jgi:hypothetical protein
MKKSAYLFVCITLISSFAAGCGKTSTLQQAPQQTYQPTTQYPGLANPAYQQAAPINNEYTQPVGKFPPDSPDMSNPANSNLPVSPAPAKSTNSKTTTVSTDKIVSDDGSSLLPDNLPALEQPSAQPSAEPPAPEPKVPWYKKIINKVKSIFSKSS